MLCRRPKQAGQVPLVAHNKGPKGKGRKKKHACNFCNRRPLVTEFGLREDQCSPWCSTFCMLKQAPMANILDAQSRPGSPSPVFDRFTPAKFAPCSTTVIILSLGASLRASECFVASGLAFVDMTKRCDCSFSSRICRYWKGYFAMMERERKNIMQSSS